MSLHDSTTIPTTDTLTIPVPALACPAWCTSCAAGRFDDFGAHSSGDAFGTIEIARKDHFGIAHDGTVTVTPGGVRLFLPDGAERGDLTLDLARVIAADLTRALAALDGITADN